MSTESAEAGAGKKAKNFLTRAFSTLYRNQSIGGPSNSKICS